MAEQFPIIEIPVGSNSNLEPMGTKPKFWFFLTHGKVMRQYLYKDARTGTGEDWAEKVACELCALLGLPHADYELATYQGRHGVASPQFLKIPDNVRAVLDQATLLG